MLTDETQTLSWPVVTAQPACSFSPLQLRFRTFQCSPSYAPPTPSHCSPTRVTVERYCSAHICLQQQKDEAWQGSRVLVTHSGSSLLLSHTDLLHPPCSASRVGTSDAGSFISMFSISQANRNLPTAQCEADFSRRKKTGQHEISTPVTTDLVRGLQRLIKLHHQNFL